MKLFAEIEPLIANTFLPISLAYSVKISFFEKLTKYS